MVLLAQFNSRAVTIALWMAGQAKHVGLFEFGEPPTFSTVPKAYGKELKSYVDALRHDDEWYEVIGGERGEGAIIVSKLQRQVDFAVYLVDRTANFVPCESSARYCTRCGLPRRLAHSQDLARAGPDVGMDLSQLRLGERFEPRHAPRHERPVVEHGPQAFLLQRNG